MEEFFLKLCNSMLSEAGILATVLFIGLIYQTSQLNKERNKLDLLRSQLTELSVSYISAMKGVENVLEKLIDLMPSRSLKND